MSSVLEALSVSRVYPCPRELVFKAWTEPVRLERWFCPNPSNRVKAQIDLKVGGHYRIAMVNPSGESWVIGGEYREIERPGKLVFTWNWEDSEEPTSLVTVSLSEVQNGTLVELVHDKLDSSESQQQHLQGWTLTFERLAAYLMDPMETALLPPSDLLGAAAQINTARDLARMALDRLRLTFSHVPSDRVHESPSPDAKSALRILVHAGLANQYFAAVLRGDEMPHMSAEEVVANIAAHESSITDRSEAEALLATSSKEVLDAIDRVDPGRLTTDPKCAFVLLLVGRHADGHASQIDYLQTTWGDLVDHFVK